MALFPPRNPLLRQPSHLARIDPRHWLARDLLFVHSGYSAFVKGQPVEGIAETLASNALTGSHNPALVGANGWKPDATNYAVYPVPPLADYPLTLSAWWFGTSGGSVDGILTLGRSAGVGGYVLRRSTGELVQSLAHTTSNQTAGTTTASGGYASGRWQHGVATFVSATSRNAYADGGNAGTVQTAYRAFIADLDRVIVGGTASSPPIAATTVIGGIALPMVIARALDDEEIAFLHEEQRSNPWTLFTERPIWVPVTSAPDYVRPQIHTPRAAVTRASRW